MVKAYGVPEEIREAVMNRWLRGREIIHNPKDFCADLEPWSSDWIFPRKAKVKLREIPEYPLRELRAGASSPDGHIVYVQSPRRMESDGHSLYAGKMCWDLVADHQIEYDTIYLCEDDLEWIEGDWLT